MYLKLIASVEFWKVAFTFMMMILNLGVKLVWWIFCFDQLVIMNLELLICGFSWFEYDQGPEPEIYLCNISLNFGLSSWGVSLSCSLSFKPFFRHGICIIAGLIYWLKLFFRYDRIFTKRMEMSNVKMKKALLIITVVFFPIFFFTCFVP